MKTVLLILLIIMALYAVLTFYLFRIGFMRYKNNKVPSASSDNSTGKAWKAYGDTIKSGIDWFKAQNAQTVEITSDDGIKLRALLLPCENAKGVLIGMHGYRSNPLRDLGASSRYYHELGFTLLLPNQRACGDSEGKYLTFGAKERYDVRAWARYASDNFGADTPIVLAGISLGCSSVLMSLDTGLTKNVRAAVADCGYSSLYDELSVTAYRFFHFRWPRPILWGVNIWCKKFAGVDIFNCTTLDSMKNTSIPVLFIHGEADDFVPTRFSRENYDACAAPKELFTVPGAGHGLSYLADTPGYHRALEAFLEKYCFTEGALK